LIADTALKVPDADQVPRSRIETALALWGHRFPEVIEEAELNYKAGTLMQSMECRSATYSCAECGKSFPKLPEGAERANWCQHMKASDGNGARILGDVTFTGTGLIFGTRGAKGAYDEAHLDVLQDEVAEFHEKAQRDSRPRRKKTSMDTIDVSREEYAELQKRPTAEELATEKKRADDAETAKAEAEKKAEEFETEAKKEKARADEAEKKVTEAEEAKAKDELAKERLSKLGTGFKAKLGDFTRERFEDQARSLSDEEWEGRVKELEETAGVKRDEGGTEKPAAKPGEGKEFSREETAAAHVGGGSNGNNGNGEEPSPESRRGVMSGLMGKKPTTTASE
jgi:colicin import membrane protein